MRNLPGPGPNRKLCGRDVIKTGCRHNNSLSSHIPVYRDGGEAVENLIKEIARRLVLNLDELEQGADFDTLANIPDPGIRQEALQLQEEITQLKMCLQNI